MGHAETFEHTADLGLRVCGADLPDLFEAGAGGLFDVIVVNREEVRADETETVSLSAETVPDLFMTWLNELIFRSETGHRLFARYRVRIGDGPGGLRLEAEIAGEPIDRDRHILDHEVKAATRHGLSVHPIAGGWQAEVILDI